MGRTFVRATITGTQATREYGFLVDTGATFVGLPLEEIQALGLTLIPRGRIQILAGTGVVEVDSYAALGELEGRGFSATVIPSPIPLIGYEVLENLRFRVNPITRRLEPVPPEEPHPPFQLLALISS